MTIKEVNLGKIAGGNVTMSYRHKKGGLSNMIAAVVMVIIGFIFLGWGFYFFIKSGNVLWGSIWGVIGVLVIIGGIFAIRHAGKQLKKGEVSDKVGMVKSVDEIKEDIKDVKEKIDAKKQESSGDKQSVEDGLDEARAEIERAFRESNKE